MSLFNKIIDIYKKWQRKRLLKKRIEELKKRDPFIY
jgi:hypothetical protein